MNAQWNQYRINIKELHSFWWLLFAGLLFPFSEGSFTIGLAAWLMPVCLLRFVRMRSARSGIGLAYGFLVIFRGVVLFRMVPIPGIFYIIFVLFSGVSAVIPYLVDRLLRPRLPQGISTFVFPVALVSTQFIYGHGPMGSWGSVAYTQAGNLALLQILSVTGLAGLTFLIGWFVAVANEAIENDIPSQGVSRSCIAFCSVLLAVFIFGATRLTFFAPKPGTVRVASLSLERTGNESDTSPTLLKDVVSGKATELDVSAFRAASALSQTQLLNRSESEAISGAKIVFWSEGAVSLLARDEPPLLESGRALAAKYQIYLAMAVNVWTPKRERPLQNKVVMITPAGEIAWQYLKGRPTPGPEAAMSAPSDGRLRGVESPYGTLTSAICYDTDFPSYMRQAGGLAATIVLSPANDWAGIDPRHTEISSFRAIEQGFNLVRQASNGLSAAFDYEGRTIASMDGFKATEFTLVAQIPTHGIKTLYSYLGDWLAWSCCGGLVALLATACFKRQIPNTR